MRMAPTGNPMKYLIAILASCALCLTAHALPGKLRVVTTIPDLADIARQIGGDRVDVKSIAKGTQNVHNVPLRPSTLVAMNKADLFIQVGLSLEHAYVPGLLMQARNAAIRPEAPGFVNVSEGWGAIQIPPELTRRQGTDLHPMGNPHFNLDPRGGRHIAARILAGLVRVDPEGQAYYEKRSAAYLTKLSAAEDRWAEIGKQLKGQRIVTYHADFNYLLAYHAMDLVATVEPQAGVPPTPKDLAKLVELMKAEEIGLILTAKWSNNKSVRFVAEKTGATIIEGPTMVGGVPGADTWISMMDVLHASLQRALE
ncbi:MAG: zinc/manganese transport system substrate-binding protein [Chlamydiales bacterium]|jgi:zinc/manganese transport system substrate-binding protein